MQCFTVAEGGLLFCSTANRWGSASPNHKQKSLRKIVVSWLLNGQDTATSYVAQAPENNVLGLASHTHSDAEGPELFVSAITSGTTRPEIDCFALSDFQPPTGKTWPGRAWSFHKTCPG